MLFFTIPAYFDIINLFFLRNPEEVPMKRFVPPAIIALLLISMLSVPALAEPAPAPAPRPGNTASPRDWDEKAPNGDLLPSAINAGNAILIDAYTGKVLFEKDADVKRYPASTTKIMTCLLALKSDKKLTDRVTANSTVIKVPSDSSSIKLIAGETMTLGNLLYGLMLESGNDAANVIGAYVGGSLENFIVMMNDEAKNLGMTNTHYVTTHGYHDPEHYTTARDMAVLAREAMKYPEFAKIVSTYSYTMKATNKHPEPTPWKNSNRLINPSKNESYSYIYATGIKTGFHSKALNTLVSSAKKDGQNLISVVLYGKSPKQNATSNYFTDSITMFEYGFEFFDTLNLKEFLTEQTIQTEIKNASVDDPGQGKLDLILKPQSLSYITDRQDVIDQLRADPSKFQQELNILRDTAPIMRDQILGMVTFYYEGNPVLTCDLLAAREVKEMATPAPTVSLAPTGGDETGAQQSENPLPGGTPPVQHKPVNGGLGYMLVTAAVVALLLVLVLLVVRMVSIRRRGRRYSQYNYRGGAKMRR